MQPLYEIYIHQVNKVFSRVRLFLRCSFLAIFLMNLVGCYVASEEGQRLSRIGGELITVGHSDDLINVGPDLGLLVTTLCSKGTSAVYPVKGDVQSEAAKGSATHHLIIRCSRGDVVLRLQYDSKVRKFRFVEYFKPKKLRYLGGRWSIER